MSLYERLLAEFERRFSRPPVCIVRAPGRISLFGNPRVFPESQTLSIAIDRSVWVALEPRDDRQLVLHNLDVDDMRSCRLADLLDAAGRGGWFESVRTAAERLLPIGAPLEGWQGILTSDPDGANAVGAAAMELAFARVFSIASGFPWDQGRAAVLTNSPPALEAAAIIDRAVAADGHECRALLGDPFSGTLRPISLPQRITLIVFFPNSAAVGSPHRQCNALSTVSVQTPGPQRLTEAAEESARADQAADGLERNDTANVGRLMNESHLRLTSSDQAGDAIDIFVQAAQSLPGFHGARRADSSAGDVGIALVDPEVIDKSLADLDSQMQRCGVPAPKLFVCRSANGAEIVDKLPR